MTVAVWEEEAPARLLVLPVWPVALLTLWDFYVGGIRPFDHLALLSLLTAIWVDPTRRFNREGMARTLMLMGALWFVILASVFRNADVWKTAFGVLEGGFVAMIILSGYLRREDMQRLLMVLIVIHASATIFQFLIFHTLHYSLNYQAFLGTHLRTEIGFGIRPAGLFLEPAAFSLMMFSLLSLYRIVGARDARIELLGISTIILSLSLWGWISVIVYMAVFRMRWFFLVMPFVAAAGIYVAVKLSNYQFNQNIIMWTIVQRVLRPGSDPSSHTRYGALLGTANISDWQLWLGEGVKTDYTAFGGNGLSFLLSSGGLIGGLIIILLWWLILPWGRKLQGLTSLVFMLSAASQWTFCWWWAWLAVAGTAGTCVRASGANQLSSTQSSVSRAGNS